jgi:hypothetical protein
MPSAIGISVLVDEQVSLQERPAHVGEEGSEDPRTQQERKDREGEDQHRAVVVGVHVLLPAAHMRVHSIRGLVWVEESTNPLALIAACTSRPGRLRRPTGA